MSYVDIYTLGNIGTAVSAIVAIVTLYILIKSSIKRNTQSAIETGTTLAILKDRVEALQKDVELFKQEYIQLEESLRILNHNSTLIVLALVSSGALDKDIVKSLTDIKI